MSEAQVLTRPDQPDAVAARDCGAPVLAASITGILAASVLLIVYYVFVIKCGLDWHRGEGDDDNVPLERRRSQIPTNKLESRGLDGAAIRAIPIVQYPHRGGNGIGSWKEGLHDGNCAICLAEFQPGELLRRLLSCYHNFHIDCVDAWLQSNANCPLCRSDIANVKQGQPDGRDSTEVVIEVHDEVCASPGNGEASRLPMKACIGLVDDCSIGTLGKDSRGEFQWTHQLRRSFSLDSSSSRRLYPVAEQMLADQPQWHVGNCGRKGSSIIGEASS